MEIPLLRICTKAITRKKIKSYEQKNYAVYPCLWPRKSAKKITNGQKLEKVNKIML